MRPNLSPATFTQQSEVTTIISELRKDAAKKEDGKYKVSDVEDQHGNQYINLVQEGGAVLGIALVGFTYVLEQMGVRFWRLAGTSAGAINTILLAAINEKHEAKSEEILRELGSKPLIDFVDGHRIVRYILSKMMKNSGYITNTMFFIGGILALLMISLIINTFHHSDALSWFVLVLFIFTLVLTGYLAYLFRLFRKSEWGLNGGSEFQNWLIDILNRHDAGTLDGLKKKSEITGTGFLKLTGNDLQLRKGADSKVDSMKSDVTMIACDITSGMKVELPGMAKLYQPNSRHIHPAEFVRASMSIPVFFRPKFFDDINIEDPDVIAQWKTINNHPINPKAYFIDGGVISNFPISVMHQPSIEKPRLPVIGVKLMDMKPDAPEFMKSFMSYIYQVFNTVRFNYDKDFLMKNNFYKKYIIEIDVTGFNWLNFSMPVEDQYRLFMQGVLRADRFLRDFDWAEYKREREELYHSLSHNPRPTEPVQNQAAE